MKNVLQIYTVYKQPTDFPNNTVVRRFYVDTDIHPDDYVCIYDDPQKVSEDMARLGLYRLERSDLDDPCIVETWL